MTITFSCPYCGNLCAFDAEHVGRQARCMNCRQRFIIPSADAQKAQKVLDEATEPLEGFYREVFVRTWPIFFQPENLAGMVFLVAVISFKFFAGHINYSFVVGRFAVNVPIDWITIFLCWGCLLWFYMAVIEQTALEARDFPDMDVGWGFEFFWTLFKSIYLFIVAVALAEIPFMVVIAVLYKGLGINWAWFRHLMGLTGLFFVPMMLLAVSSAKQMWMALRPDFIVVPVFKAFGPYLVCAVLTALAGLLQLMTVEYGALKDASIFVIAGHLLFNIVAVIAAVIAMRSIGLFFRHYECHFPWR